MCVCVCVSVSGPHCHHGHGAVHQTAAAVPGLGSGRLADAAAPLRGLREGLRRVLPGPGPLLRLGRHRVLQILSHRQEVDGASTCTRTLARTQADKYLPFISPRCLLSSRSSCARRHGFCVNDVTGGRTWELSAHLQPAAALLKGVSVHRRLSLTSTGLLTSADVMLLSASWNFYFCGRNSTCLDLNSPANEVQTVH